MYLSLYSFIQLFLCLCLLFLPCFSIYLSAFPITIFITFLSFIAPTLSFYLYFLCLSILKYFLFSLIVLGAVFLFLSHLLSLSISPSHFLSVSFPSFPLSRCSFQLISFLPIHTLASCYELIVSDSLSETLCSFN